MRLVGITWLILAAAVLFLAATSPPLEPWKWTLDQRMAARFDSVSRAARVASAHDRESQLHRRNPSALSMPNTPAASDIIDGSSHPELFTPTELFEHFVWMAYTLDSPVWRESMRQRSDDILRTDADWRKLDAIVAAYAQNLRRESELSQRQGQSSAAQRRELLREQSLVLADRCSIERQALRAARATFGVDRFNRFLYLVAARGYSSSYVPENDFAETRKRLQETERNCQ